MTQLTLTQTRIAQGCWHGLLTGAGDDAPPLQASHLGRALEGLALAPLPDRPGQFAVQLPIPADILSEGVQTVLFTLGDATLAQFTLVAGSPLDDDLRAEISLLRAELDLLKRAFRRHCAETGALG